MAHLQPGATLVIVDRLEDVETCRKAVPVLRYVARRIIDGEIVFAISQRPTTTVSVERHNAQQRPVHSPAAAGRTGTGQDKLPTFPRATRAWT